MAPAPSRTSKIQGGVWDLTLSGVRQCMGDYGNVEPKHWVVCLTLLFPYFVNIEWKTWPHKGYGENSVGCTEQRPVLLVVLNPFFLRP